MTTKTNLFEAILESYNSGKTAYPKSIVAVDHDGAFYFLYNDAELVADLYGKKLEAITDVVVQDGETKTITVPFCIIDKAEHNDLALCLYENKLLMIIIKKELTFMESVAAIVKPYNDAIIGKLDLDKIFGRTKK